LSGSAQARDRGQSAATIGGSSASLERVQDHEWLKTGQSLPVGNCRAGWVSWRKPALKVKNLVNFAGKQGSRWLVGAVWCCGRGQSEATLASEQAPRPLGQLPVGCAREWSARTGGTAGKIATGRRLSQANNVSWRRSAT